MTAQRVPEFVEHPGYGIYPCSDRFHTARRTRHVGAMGVEWVPFPKSCPRCGNGWWSTDGTQCPEEIALIAEIDALRSEVGRLRAFARRVGSVCVGVIERVAAVGAPPPWWAGTQIDPVRMYDAARDVLSRTR